MGKAELVRLVVAFAMLIFCPLDGGSDDFVGVLGSLSARLSSSAMRASSWSILASSVFLCQAASRA